MSVKCIDVINIMEKYASSEMAESWDNVGMILGNENSIVNRVLVALDIDDYVIEEAINLKCELIITHHPFIFKGIKKIKTSDILGNRIIKLVKNDISVYSAHTNLDIAKNGTNETFAKMLGLNNIQNIFKSENSELGIGRMGYIEKLTFLELINKVKAITLMENLIVCGDFNREINKVAICTGSGGDLNFILEAKNQGCDVYITGDIKYHNSQLAKDLNLCLIDTTHYASEVLIVPVICEYIAKCSKRLNLNIQCFASKVDGQTLKIV